MESPLYWMELSLQPMWLCFECIILAQFCFGMSYAIFQTVERGMNAVDAYYLLLYKTISCVLYRCKNKLGYPLFVLGFLLGGMIGIGTLLSTCLTGVTTRWLYKKVVSIKCKWKFDEGMIPQEDI